MPAIASAIVAAVTISLFGICLIAAAAEGDVGPAQFSGDVSQLLGESPSKYNFSEPFVRDYVTMLFTLLTGASYWQMARQWTRLEKFPNALSRSGLLRTDSIPKEEFAALVNATEERSCQTRWEWLSLIIACVVVVGVALTITQSGIYPLVDVGAHAGGSVAKRHLAAWWADPTTRPVGLAAFSVVIGSFLYLTVRHSIMGLHMLCLMGRLRRLALRCDATSWYGYENRWSAWQEGVAESRGTLLDVFGAILLGALAAAAAVYGLALPPIIIAVLVGYLIYNLFVLIIPWAELNRQLAISKADLIKTMTAEIRSHGAGEHIAALEPTTASLLSLQRVENFPDRVLSRRGLSVLITLYIIPVIGIIPAYTR